MLFAFPFHSVPGHSRPYESHFQGPPVPQELLARRKGYSFSIFRLPKCIRPLNAAIALLLSVFLTFSALEVFGAELDTLRGEGVLVLFPPSLEQVAQETARIAPKIKKNLQEIFHWPFTFTPTVMLVKDRQLFRNMTHSPLVVGFAVPKKDLVVIDYTGIRNPSQFGNILKHELCHLLIHKHVNRVHIPRWFDEGIAQWVSDGVMDIVHDQKEALLPKAAFSDQIIPLGALKNGFPGNANELRLAYEESKSFIDYIIRTHGKSRLLEILHLMKNGVSLRKAVIEALGTPLFEMEEKWRGSIERNIAWFAHVSYYLYELLFALGGLMVVYGFIRIWRRKRSYMDEA